MVEWHHHRIFKMLKKDSDVFFFVVPFPYATLIQRHQTFYVIRQRIKTDFFGFISTLP